MRTGPIARLAKPKRESPPLRRETGEDGGRVAEEEEEEAEEGTGRRS